MPPFSAMALLASSAAETSVLQVPFVSDRVSLSPWLGRTKLCVPMTSVPPPVPLEVTVSVPEPLIVPV